MYSSLLVFKNKHSDNGKYVNLRYILYNHHPTIQLRCIDKKDMIFS